MRRNLVLMLMLLAIPMMGSQCRWGVKVDNSVPSKETKPPASDTGGLTVVVGTVAGVLEPEDIELEAMAGLSIVSSALEASVDSIPTLEPTASESPSGALDPIDAVGHPIASASDTPSAPIPEPGGMLLFSIGLATVVIARIGTIGTRFRAFVLLLLIGRSENAAVE